MRTPSPLLLAASIAAASAVSARAQTAPEPHLVSRAGEAMGTYVEIKVWTRDEPGARAAMGRAFDEIARIERLMTTWRDDSDISRVNAAAGLHPVEVSPETFECVARAQQYSRLSGGAFDVTFYALKGLWHFDEDKEAKLPDPAEVKRRLPLIDYRKLILDEKRRTLYLAKKGMAINLGGIAKGYAVDRAVAVLKKAGFPNAIVQAGGDLMCAGSKGGAPWTSGIRDPRGARSDVFAVMKLMDHAFSTAGDYERYFIIDGKRYHHIIDPRTGFPAMASRSVTIYAPNATIADSIDDAIFILGWKKGFEMIESLPYVGCVIVDAKNQVHVSKRLEGLVHILHPPTDVP